MSRQKFPSCFIAMAFGKDDTDAYYENLILPVLKRNAIKPVIINRRQSNDDLNIQIIEQIKLADLCIVDLTYARPSVYYEAGFAQHRDIPVIYTARKDHLKKGQPDSLRVHFDLTMKPIITWDDLNDKSFSSRLEKRIRTTFLNNWNRKQKVNNKKNEAEESFQKLTTLERLKNIRKDTIKLLKNKGFSYWNVYEYFIDQLVNYQTPKFKLYEGFYNHVFGHKIDNKVMYYASVHTFTSPSKTELLYIQKNLTSGFSYQEITRDLIDKKNIKQIICIGFVLSLNNVMPNRIENTLKTIVLADNNKYYQDSKTTVSLFLPKLPKLRKLPVTTNYLFVSGIKSRIQLKERLAPIIKDLLIKGKK